MKKDHFGWFAACIISMIVTCSLFFYMFLLGTNENTKIVKTEEIKSDPCTDPYYTVVIDGITYSGSTQTANQAYLHDAQTLKKVLYDDSLKKDDKWKRVANIKESMGRLAKFRCLCKKNCESIPLDP